MLHLVVRIDHVLLCSIYIITQFFDAHILSCNLFVEILGFVFGRFNHADNFVELVILISDLLLL